MNELLIHQKPNLVLSILQNKCPRCRRGKLYKHNNAYRFKNTLEMHDSCPVCRQSLNMEVGFYYGTGYVSYALSITICVASFIAWWVLIGFSFSDSRFFWWMGINAVLLIGLQPILMRLSRTVWLAFFVHYSPDWHKGDVVKAERTNLQMENAW